MQTDQLAIGYLKAIPVKLMPTVCYLLVGCKFTVDKGIVALCQLVLQLKTTFMAHWYFGNKIAHARNNSARGNGLYITVY